MITHQRYKALAVNLCVIWSLVKGCLIGNHTKSFLYYDFIRKTRVSSTQCT